jgi:hypothetical protein
MMDGAELISVGKRMISREWLEFQWKNGMRTVFVFGGAAREFLAVRDAVSISRNHRQVLKRSDCNKVINQT